MAIVNGTEYEFIDMKQASGGNTTRHMLRDAQAREKNAVQDNELAQLKSALSELTYNLVTGVMADTTISNTGRLEYDSTLVVFYAPVESGKTYTALVNEGSLICAFYSDIPTAGAFSYNQKRVIQSSKTITAPITGYMAVRSVSPFEKCQIVEGSEEKAYLPHISATDYVARKMIEETAEAVDEVDQKLESTAFDAYTGITSGYTEYASSEYYTVCQISSGVKITTIDILGKNGKSCRMALIYPDGNNGYLMEKFFVLPDGTGSFQTVNIDYIIQHECYLALGNTFGFARSTTRTDLPIIFRSDGVNVVDPTAGTAPLDYTINVHCESVPVYKAYFDEMKDTIIDVKMLASDIAMFENVGFCGDSYMAGMIVVSENPTVTAQNTSLCWGKILERTHGINAFIYAKGGAKTSDFITDTDCLPKLLSETAKQLYVVSLGHNDAYNSTPVASFKASYETILDSIIQHAPNARIVLCRQSKGYGNMNNGQELNEAISEIGVDYNIPVLDPEDDPYLSSAIYVQTQVHNHPVFAGYAGMAEAFNRLFSKATVDYWDYFKEYTGL